MQKNIVIWSLLGAIAVSALYPEPSEARRRGGFSSYRRQSPSVFRPGRRSRIASRQPYYRPVSYTLAQIDRSGAPAKSAPRREAPRRRSIPQGDDRFPIAAEPVRRLPNLPREPQSGVNQAKANSLRNYAKNQPYQAMRKLLGEPTRRTEDGTEIYNLKGTGSPFQASRRLVVRYRKTPDGQTITSSWHQE